MKYVGVGGSEIIFNPEEKLWRIRVAGRPWLSATARLEYGSLVLGTHSWIITNDTDCQAGTVEKIINLSSCKKGGWKWRLNKTTRYWDFLFEEGEFTCNNGMCVDITKRCNGEDDCQVIPEADKISVLNFS